MARMAMRLYMRFEVSVPVDIFRDYTDCGRRRQAGIAERRLRSIGPPGLAHVDIMMFSCKHQDVRTTLTLDEDVAAKLAAEARRSGESFKQTVNRLLRFALLARARAKAPPPFVVQPARLGLRDGLSYDDVWGLIEQIEATPGDDPD